MISKYRNTLPKSNTQKISEVVGKLEKRIADLEAQLVVASNKPDPTLEADEWYAIFSNFQDTTKGIITKVPWQGGSNATAVYKVKRIS